MALKFDFTDYFRLTKPNDEQIAEWKDYMGGMTSTNRTGLRIVMEATHAGYLNRNGRIYIPSRMAEGVASFRTGEKPTKLLKHHKPDEDPVGVIRGARFVPTVPDELTDNPDVINLMSSSAPIKTQIKSIRNLLRNGTLSQEGWRGLGYIELIGDVFDKKTIEQVQDGRFDAVSTNFRSPGAVHCLVCGHNWAKDGMCDHEPGELHEDELEDGVKFPAAAIAGVHDYLETSFITFEGDPLVSINVMDGVDSKNNKKFFLPDNWEEDTVNSKPTFEFKDFKEDDMAKPAKKDEITLSDAEQKVFVFVKGLRDSIEDKVLAEYAQKISGLRGENGLFPDQEEAGIDEETAVQYALEDLETADDKVDVEAVYALYEKELEELELSDAKLSTKTRKGLPDSAFCGPDRAFPVPDCAHVTAAKRLVGSYKGPGNKAKILACVNRKAKSLGCDSSDSQTESDPNNIPAINLLPCTEDSILAMTDEALRNMHLVAEVALINRGQKMAYECKECAVHEERVKKASKEVMNAKTEVAKMKDTLTILREELQRSYADYAAQVDITVEASASLYTEKLEKLALIGVLNKKYDNLDKAREEIKGKPFDKLELAIMDGFNLEEVTMKLNDGMTNNPNGIEVPDPTINPDGDNIPLPEGLSEVALEAIANIKEFVEDGKISDAQHIYATMKSLKLFPDDLTFDSLSVEKKPTE